MRNYRRSSASVFTEGLHRHRSACPTISRVERPIAPVLVEIFDCSRVKEMISVLQQMLLWLVEASLASSAHQTVRPADLQNQLTAACAFSTSFCQYSDQLRSQLNHHRQQHRREDVTHLDCLLSHCYLCPDHLTFLHYLLLALCYRHPRELCP